MMWLIKKFFSFLVKFFSTKAGKTTAKVMAGVGAAAGGVAAGEMIVARKRNRRAERIKAAAIKKHDKGRAEVESTLNSLGETKYEIYKNFGVLADAIQQIQQRPDYELRAEGIELPSFEPAEFKQLAIEIEAAIGGLGGVAAGGAIGAAAMGTGTILALAPGALLGGVVLCAVGAKMLHRSAENIKMARNIESDVDAILTYYEDLNKAAKRFHKSFEKIKNPYLKYVRKVQKVVDRKTDWNKFSKSEKLVVENAIRLAQLLHRMCSVQLTTLAPKEIAQEKVNTSEINRAIADANFVFEQLD